MSALREFAYYRILRPQHWESEVKVICGWLLHCKRFLAIFAVFLSVLSSVRPVYVLTLPPLAPLSGHCCAMPCRAVDDFRERGSNRLIDLRGPLTFPECPYSWLT